MYAKVPLESGGEFLIQTEVAGDGVVRATRADETVKSSAETFETSLNCVRSVAEAIIGKLSGFPTAPDHIRAEFGISLGAQAAVVVVKGTAEAHFVIELEWSGKPAG
ncbi:MAG: hypothetical protein JOY82_10095 [Streptosporangiaceae bacterium]|nr:hypothetical protein [Streptosporangiaceae bacterium]MBV9854861.1 hypothetical protein [Streptosporangiaceae bacterium]